MSENITVWTLNMAANLLDTHKCKIKSAFRKKGYKARFGDRRPYNINPECEEQGYNHNLMPDIEYFVPIFPKCFGNLIDGSTNPLINNIKAYYTGCGQENFPVFWTERYKHWMLTRDYTGYYTILKDNAPNVLIGYSQGGLVARYLAWMAEHVFNEPELIKCVITLSSPLFGSPLGNKENNSNILDGLGKILSALFPCSWEPVKKKITAFVQTKAPEQALELTRNFMKQIIEDLKQKFKNNPFIELLIVLYEWTGGLRDDPNNAFYDINILRMEETYTEPVSGYQYAALSSIQNSPLENIYCGSVLSANLNLEELLIDAVIFALLESVLNNIQSFIKQNPELKEKIDSTTLFLRKSDRAYAKNNKGSIIKTIQDIYAKQIMSEAYNGTITNQLITRIIDYNRNGIDPVSIPPQGMRIWAHDYLIPAAYQLTTANGNIIADRNIPNYKANHLSGSTLRLKAGKMNVNNIMELIRRMP